MDDVSFVRDLRARHLAALRSAHRVLDAGCGVALISARLAGHRVRRVIAVDSDPMMLAEARRRLADRSGATLLRADVEALPIADAACDGHLSNNVLYALDDPRRALREAARTTAPGGRLSLATPRPSLDVEVLLDAFFVHLDVMGASVAPEQRDLFAAANRQLQRQLRNAWEPDELARMLAPQWRVIEVAVTYLGQLSYVQAERRDTSPWA